MKAIYFATVRERVGRSEETLSPPAGVVTVSDLLAWLAGRDEAYAAAFDKAGSIRVAIDRAHVKHDAAIAGAGEIAFFPPMTGG